MSGDSGVPEHVYNTLPQKKPLNLRQPSMDSGGEERSEERKSHGASEDSEGGVVMNP